jgi:hypothetical protein
MPKQIEMRDVERIAPKEFLRRLKKLGKKHQRMILDAMGNPPHPDNVPKELWDRIRKEQEEILLLLLIGFSIPLLNAIWSRTRRQFRDIDAGSTAGGGPNAPNTPNAGPGPNIPPGVYRWLYRSLRRRSAWASRHIVRTTRRRLVEYWDRHSADGETPNPMSALETIINDARAETIARTEMVNGGNQPALAVRNQFRGGDIRAFTVWRLGPSCEHCKVCPMLEGLEVAQTSLLTDIPVHPNCCCHFQVLVGRMGDLRSAGLIRVASAAEMAHIRDTLDQMGLYSPTPAVAP